MKDLKYQTLKKSIHSIVLKEKGSKFISYAFPVQSVQEVEENLEFVRNKYPDATHHCYAFLLADEQETHRVNDDGEPNGTAGLPIYNQLLSFELQNILVIVVRYYGGTKLGTGGLIKAYKESAKLALNEGDIIQVESMEMREISFPYEMEGEVWRMLDKLKTQIIQKEFAANIALKINIKASKIKAFDDWWEKIQFKI